MAKSKVKNCNCVIEVEKALREKYDDAKLFFSINMAGDIKAAIPYTFLKKKNNGELMKRRFDGTAVCTYCPFCGIKYK